MVMNTSRKTISPIQNISGFTNQELLRSNQYLKKKKKIPIEKRYLRHVSSKIGRIIDENAIIILRFSDFTVLADYSKRSKLKSSYTFVVSN